MFMEVSVLGIWMSREHGTQSTWQERVALLLSAPRSSAARAEKFSDCALYKTCCTELQLKEKGKQQRGRGTLLNQQLEEMGFFSKSEED